MGTHLLCRSRILKLTFLTRLNEIKDFILLDGVDSFGKTFDVRLLERNQKGTSEKEWMEKMNP